MGCSLYNKHYINLGITDSKLCKACVEEETNNHKSENFIEGKETENWLVIQNTIRTYRTGGRPNINKD